MRKVMTAILCMVMIFTMSVPAMADVSVTQELEVTVTTPCIVMVTGDENTPMPKDPTRAVNSRTTFLFSYNEPGTYVYEIKEIPGSDSDVLYDNTVYTAYVSVFYDDAGNMHSVVTAKIGDTDDKPTTISFNNKKKEKEEEPEESVPDSNPETPDKDNSTPNNSESSSSTRTNTTTPETSERNDIVPLAAPVKTGDNAAILAYFILFIISGIVIMITARKKVIRQ